MPTKVFLKNICFLVKFIFLRQKCLGHGIKYIFRYKGWAVEITLCSSAQHFSNFVLQVQYNVHARRFLNLKKILEIHCILVIIFRCVEEIISIVRRTFYYRFLTFCSKLSTYFVNLVGSRFEAQRVVTCYLKLAILILNEQFRALVLFDLRFWASEASYLKLTILIPNPPWQEPIIPIIIIPHY